MLQRSTSKIPSCRFIGMAYSKCDATVTFCSDTKDVVDEWSAEVGRKTHRTGWAGQLSVPERHAGPAFCQLQTFLPNIVDSSAVVD